MSLTSSNPPAMDDLTAPLSVGSLEQSFLMIQQQFARLSTAQIQREKEYEERIRGLLDKQIATELECRRTQAHTVQLESKLAEREADTTRLQNKIADQESLIQTLRNNIEKGKTQHKLLSRRAELRARKLVTLEAAKDAALHEVKGLQESIQAKEDEVHWLESQLDALYATSDFIATFGVLEVKDGRVVNEANSALSQKIPKTQRLAHERRRSKLYQALLNEMTEAGIIPRHLDSEIDPNNAYIISQERALTKLKTQLRKAKEKLRALRAESSDSEDVEHDGSDESQSEESEWDGELHQECANQYKMKPPYGFGAVCGSVQDVLTEYNGLIDQRRCLDSRTDVLLLSIQKALNNPEGRCEYLTDQTLDEYYDHVQKVQGEYHPRRLREKLGQLKECLSEAIKKDIKKRRSNVKKRSNFIASGVEKRALKRHLAAQDESE